MSLKLTDFFLEDSDTADTTEESITEGLDDSFVSLPEMADPDALKACLKELELVRRRYVLVQAKVAAWVGVNMDEGELSLFSETMKELNADFKDIENRVFAMCNDAEFLKIQGDFETTRSAFDVTLLKVKKSLVFWKNFHAKPAPKSSTVNVRLPKLELATFDGKTEGWLTFRDLFKASISDNAGLSGAQKLQYLNSSVKGEAENLIKGFSVTDANFTEAWDLLMGRYDNKREVLHSLFRRFFHQSPVTKECPKALRKLIDVSLECERSLKVLGYPTDDWSYILAFIVIEKVDSDTRREVVKAYNSTNIPVFAEVIEFLEKHVNALLASGVKSSGSTSSGVKSNHVSKPITKTKRPLSCYMCTEPHLLSKCVKFLALSVSERDKFIHAKRSCCLCFSPAHKTDDCPSPYLCSNCKGKHHTLLHKTKDTIRDSCGSTEAVATTNSYMSGNKSGMASVLLCTAMVKVTDAFGGFRVCRVLLDPGSESSFVTQKCITLLGLRPSKCDVEVTGISSVSVGKAKGIIRLELASFQKDFTFDVDCLVYSQVTGRLPSFTCAGESWEYLRGLPLADPKFLEPREVDILLGADVTGFLSLPGRVMRDRFSPVATATGLGWVVSGPVNQSGLVRKSNSYSVRVHHGKVETDCVVQRFWELEQVPEHPPWTAEGRECEKHFEFAHFREQGGRYGSPLPFNANISGLGFSKHLAKRRLEQTEKRLCKGTHADQYVQFMREYENLGHMELVPPADCQEVLGKTNYLPHHFVLREESTSTKLRVVFDGSAKTSTGLSINNCLLVGPKVQDDLFFHLLRFRLNPIALKADIVKMFRQFLVSRSDADFQRILWRETPDQSVKEFRLKTVTYGTASGPHSAARCMKQLSLDYLAEYPEAAKVIGKNFYVDDLLASVASREEGIRIQKGLEVLASKAELVLGKWDSNDPKVLEHVPLESRAKKSKFKLEDDKFVSKALGVSWDSHNDVLVFEGFVFRNFDRVTKRVVLSEMSRIFDPLGLLSPVTVKVKIFFQRLWTPIEENGQSRVLDWDDLLPDYYIADWDSYQKGMVKIHEVKVPRVLCVVGTQGMELHGFSDASERAYSAVVYLRTFGKDGEIHMRIVCGKTKVAPLKSQSIPKLELCGALLLARLVTAVVTGTSINCPIYTWTDSELVLKWIANSSRTWKTFVANRVAEIQEVIPNESWRFVPGELNPADCASRGLSGDELLDFHLWWSGPEFLSRPGLPMFVGKEIPSSVDMEMKTKLHVGHCGTGIEQIAYLSYNCQFPVTHIGNEWFTRYSDLIKLKRVVACVLRFRYNCKVKLQERKVGELTVGELADAFTVLIKLAQREDFGAELERLEKGKTLSVTSKVLSLNPFVDENGVLRVGGRLQRSSEPSATKHQIILSGGHLLSKLLIRHGHSALHHAGFQLLWTSLQREYWILRARSSIRNHIRKCLVCKRLKAKVSQQLMGSLPPARVTPSRPFSHTGLDYAGPFSISIAKGRGKKVCKGYFCVFLCFATKAVHIEYALELTTESFIGALKRFVARRGKPSAMYSDCGTNFTGADKELKDLLGSYNHNVDVSRFLCEQGISWHFNSPAAPHHGGLWEAGVKSVKFHLMRIVGSESVTLEEFSTVLCMVEAALNSRPLCALSPDPSDLDALTPGHFLIGEPLTAIPEPDLQHLKVNRLSRWQRTQLMFQHFWTRWSKEYVHTLQQRNKWKSALENVCVGDLVLLKEDNAPPLKWRMGRVTEVCPGVDGLVRIVKVKTQTGELKRPVVKLCPLLSKDDL